MLRVAVNTKAQEWSYQAVELRPDHSDVDHDMPSDIVVSLIPSCGEVVGA
jgi:hypothetical protein